MVGERKDIHNSDIPVICRSCEARHKGVCGALTPEQLTELSQQTRRVQHRLGDELVGDSTEIRSYANVLRGVVKLSKVLEDGRQQLVGLQFAPDFLGRLYGTEHRVTAEAATDVELCRIPKNALESVISSNPALEHKVMEQVLRELDEARDWMVTLGRKTAQEKVASFLYLIVRHIDPTGPDEDAAGAAFDLPLSRADMADFLGLTIETVSRQMTRLRSDRVILITNYRRIEVPDLAVLEERCG